MGNIDQICTQVPEKSMLEKQKEKLYTSEKQKQIQIKVSQEDNLNFSNIQKLPIKSQTPRIKQSPFSFCDHQEQKINTRDGFASTTQTKLKQDKSDQSYYKSYDKNELTLLKTSSLINQITKLVLKRGAKKFIYQGETINKQMHGYGIIYDENTKQNVYEGQFKNNYFDGWGFSEFYQGQFKLNKYQGYGIYKQFLPEKPDTITTFYQGYFRNGTFQGKGILLKNAKIPMSQLDKIHQLGVFDYIYSEIQHNMEIIKKFKIQEIYIGQFSSGLKHGFGRLFKQNFEFSGQFSNDIYHGLGTSYFSTRGGQQKALQAIYKMGKQIQN